MEVWAQALPVDHVLKFLGAGGAEARVRAVVESWVRSVAGAQPPGSASLQAPDDRIIIPSTFLNSLWCGKTVTVFNEQRTERLSSEEGQSRLSSIAQCGTSRVLELRGFGECWLWLRTALGLEGALGMPDERCGAAPLPSPLLMNLNRKDNAHRAGGAAPTLVCGRPVAAGSDSGSVSCSSPPTGCTLTAEGS
eukprot:3095981-Rhodomonas_salina.1